LALRLAAVAVVDFTPVNDPAEFVELGQSLANEGGFPPSRAAIGESAWRPPLYPLALAATFAVSGDSITAAQVVNALLGTAVAGLTGLLAARLYGRRAGLIALALAAVAPALVLVNITLLSETLFSVLALGAVLVALRARERLSLRWVAAAGLLAGAATLTRPNGVIVAAVVLVAVWRRPFLSRAAVLRPALAAVAVALVIAPWAVRNALVMDAFVPVATSGWYTASGMFNETSRADPRFPATWRVPLLDPEIAELLEDHPRDGELERAHRLREYSLDFLREHPTYPAEATARNLLRYAHITDFDLSSESWRSDGLGDRLAPVANVYFMALLVLAAAGIGLGALRKAPVWLWLLPVLLALSTAVVVTAIRYRTPVDPFIIVLAAFAIARLVDRFGPVGQGEAAT